MILMTKEKNELNDRSMKLIEASYSGDVKQINELLQNNIDVNIRDEEGFTPLMLAADRGHKDAVKVLLAAGADVNIVNNNYDTALFIAARGQSKDHNIIFGFLNAAEVGIIIDTPFDQRDLLELNEHKAILNPKGLCSGFNLEITRWAMKHIEKGEKEENINVMEKLNKELDDPQKARNFVKRLAIYQAEQHDTKSSTEKISYRSNNFLASLPAEFKNKKFIGFSFKVFNELGSQSEVHTINIRKIGNDGNKYEVIDVNFGSRKCDSQDVLNEHIESILNYYQKAADPAADKGIEVYDIEEIIRKRDLLPQKILDNDDPLVKTEKKKINKNKKYIFSNHLHMLIVDQAPIQLISEVINSGVNLEEKNKDGHTPLMLAAIEGHTEAIKALMSSKKVNLNEKNKNGNTPLMLAAIEGHTEAIKILMNSKKVNLNEKNKDEYTALMIASRLGHTEVVKALLEKGANVREKSNLGHTALMMASMFGRQDIVNILRGARNNAHTFVLAPPSFETPAPPPDHTQKLATTIGSSLRGCVVENKNNMSYRYATSNKKVLSSSPRKL